MQRPEVDHRDDGVGVGDRKTAKALRCAHSLLGAVLSVEFDCARLQSQHFSGELDPILLSEELLLKPIA